MKKIIVIITSIVMAAAFVLSIGGVASKVLAATYNDMTVKKSQFLSGIEGNNESGESITIALYDVDGMNIAFVSDGENYVFSDFKIMPATLDNGQLPAQEITVDNATFSYFEMDGGQFIYSSDGKLYAVSNITSSEAEEAIAVFL